MRDTTNLEPVIVEYGFLDNTNDSIRLQKYWDKYAEAVVKAVLEYKGLPYSTPEAGKTIYVVRIGDTLFSIANRFNTTVNEIMRVNNLTSTTLSVGKQLLIPGTGIEPTPPSGNIVYIVKAGDSLWSIARKFDVTVETIKNMNGLTSDILSIGQQLFVPGVSIDMPESTNFVYTVQSGDTLYSIASKFNTTVNEIIRINNLLSTVLSIGQRLLIPVIEIPEIEVFTYIVQRGDTLFAIANRFNTTADEIIRLNNLTSTVLSIGQELLIPGIQKFTYTVQRGDTLFAIANRFNTTVDEIIRLNNLTSTALSIGQQLLIPRI